MALFVKFTKKRFWDFLLKLDAKLNLFLYTTLVLIS